MAKSTTFDNDLLKLIYNAVAIGNIADNTATSPLTNIYVALHTADPTASGTQSSNECNYTGYARVAVPRTTAGFSISSNQANFASAVNFGAMTAGTNQTATFWSTGVAASGATKILHSGPISPTIAIQNGVTPQLTAGTNITES